jgi:hypothetical protein
MWTPSSSKSAFHLEDIVAVVLNIRDIDDGGVVMSCTNLWCGPLWTMAPCSPGVSVPNQQAAFPQENWAAIGLPRASRTAHTSGPNCPKEKGALLTRRSASPALVVVLTTVHYYCVDP